MQLIAIGESVKNLDKVTNNSLLIHYPLVEWKQVMGMRDVLSHHYFDLDAELVFSVCKTLNSEHECSSKTNVILIQAQVQFTPIKPASSILKKCARHSPTLTPHV